MRFTIKLKLGLAFGLIILMLVGATGYGIASLGSMNTAMVGLISGPVARMKLAQDVRAQMLQIVRSEKNITIETDPEKIKVFDRELTSGRVKFEGLLYEGDKISTAAGKEKYAELRAIWESVKPLDTQLREFALANKNKEAAALSLGELRQATSNVVKLSDEVVGMTEERMKADQDAAAAAYAMTRNVLVAIVVGAVLIAIGAALWIAISISKGLHKIAQLADAIAIGDLNTSVVVNSDDEIKDLVDTVNRMTANLRATATLADEIADGDLTVQPKPLSEKDMLGLALERMVERLRSVVGNALIASDNVSAGSQELSATAEQVSQGAAKQAAAAEQASASMEEMAANIKQNADNAAQTEKISRQSAKDAESSGEAVNQAVKAMQTIAEKITIVQEIARQTDLLALNAAVEAARAGEHGRGFAVVASEVRKLAERSQVAATEIGAVSTQTVEAAQSAGDKLSALVPNIRRTAELVSEISAACREQDVGASQINDAIQQLDKVTQQNASASEEMTATSEELAGQAEELQASIAFFRTDASSAGEGVEMAPVRASAVRSATKSAPAAQSRAKAASPARKANGVAAQQARAKGFALELTRGGPDADDADFKAYG